MSQNYQTTSDAFGAVSNTLPTAIDDPISCAVVHKSIQNSVLIWLQGDLHEDDSTFETLLHKLRTIIFLVNVFSDAEECIDFLGEIEEERAFMIITDSLTERVIPIILRWQQLQAVYVLLDDTSPHYKSTTSADKIKGTYKNIDDICYKLKREIRSCDRNTISTSFQDTDPLFMYTQLLKEALLEVEDDDAKSLSDFVTFCQRQDGISQQNVEKIAQEYRQHTPIWWYTSDTFLYSMLNRGLRLMDVDVILNLGFFIRDLHKQIGTLHKQQKSSGITTFTQSFTVYRGQALAKELFEKMKATTSGLISFNNFLSTSFSREKSLAAFARPAAQGYPEQVGVLFNITIDPYICDKLSIPFADIREYGQFGDTEEEVLLSTHTIFRIESIRKLTSDTSNSLWEVQLHHTGDENNTLDALTSHFRQKWRSKGWFRFANILIEIGLSETANYLFKLLFQKARSEEELATYLNASGTSLSDMGEYNKALSSYHRALEIRLKALRANHPRLATSYNNIGLVYSDMGEYSKALSSYYQALKIYRKALPANHPHWAISYNNIGLMNFYMGEYAKALLSYHEALEILRKTLPANHPRLTILYNNIGLVYYDMNEHSNALSSYHRALEIRLKALPANHPHLATLYNNIGLVYSDMGEYSKALSSHHKGLEILRKALPANHPRLATSYNNIGLVYSDMGEYSKALSYYRKALEIRLKALPANHRRLTTSYNNMGSAYSDMGEYSKALSLYYRALEIRSKALSANHPDLATSYHNIGLVYSDMGEYSNALSFLRTAEGIWNAKMLLSHPTVRLLKRNIDYVEQLMR